MITDIILKECNLAFEEFFQSLIIDFPESQHQFEEIRGHSLRVVSNSLLLANILLQTEDEKRIATINALFHDLGKASLYSKNMEPQVIQREHATVSAKIIQHMDFYQTLPAEVQLIILKSIENHSIIKLPKLDNDQQTLYAKLLRDADKLDVFDSSFRFFKERYGIQPVITIDLNKSTEVSEKILKSIWAGKPASYEDMKSMNDYKLVLISMAFDLNFKYTFRVMSEKQYIQKIYETLPKRDQIIDVYRHIKLFVENKFVS
ncbi:MAG: HD domain-containing protein [Verrucomicrobia bacterium]|nr:HD domain-containing protein [Prolixibacteraceae bacterium]